MARSGEFICAQFIFPIGGLRPIRQNLIGVLDFAVALIHLHLRRGVFYAVKELFDATGGSNERHVANFPMTVFSSTCFGSATGMYHNVLPLPGGGGGTERRPHGFRMGAIRMTWINRKNVEQ